MTGGGGEQQGAGERRARTQQLVNDLLRERELLLVRYCRVAGLEPYHHHEGEDLERLLRDFCQVLVDYVAAVEFELLSRLTEGTERRREVLRTAESCYGDIAASEEVVLAFNDKYETLGEPHLLDSLPQDLSALGDTLAGRFELEDRMFGALR